MFMLQDVYCAALGNTAIPGKIPEMIHLIYTVLLVAIPVLLVIFGMLDLGKAVMAQKEDEIKKGQQTFTKRLIAAVVVFLVMVIVQLVIGLVGEDGYWNCAKCLINNDCSTVPEG